MVKLLLRIIVKLKMIVDWYLQEMELLNFRRGAL